MADSAINMRNPVSIQPARLPLAGRASPSLISAAGFTMSTARVESSHRNRPSASAVWVLEMFTQGKMDVSIEQQPARTVGPQWGAIYPPATRYREILTPGQDCHSVVIFFDLGRGDILQRLAGLKPAGRFIHDPQGELGQIAQRVMMRLYGNDADQLAAMGDFLLAMALLTGASDDGQVLAITREARQDLVSQAQRYMLQRMHQPIGVPDLARHLHMSESGFAHAYRRLAGQSPMQDLRRLRIEAVKSQLLHNRLTLARIAEITGFADAFHLSHTFRKVTGVSPRAFRKQAMHDQPR